MRLPVFLALLTFLGACGPSLQPGKVRSSDELVDEQERIAAEQERKEAEQGGEVAEAGETDADKRRKFDERQYDLEIRRAARSAETCVGVVTEDGPKGVAKVTLKFGPEGRVLEAAIAPPFEGTQVGKCALKAMQAVIVPPFVGEPVVKEWEVNLGAPAAQ